MIWATFGEVSTIAGPATSSHSPAMAMTVHLVWAVFTNILLMNLLISMMSETFHSDLEDTLSAVSTLAIYSLWL
jgi:hypothetical protein